MGLAKEDEGSRWVGTASTVPTSGSQPLDPHLHPRAAQFATGGWINHDPLTTNNFPSVLLLSQIGNISESYSNHWLLKLFLPGL